MGESLTLTVSGKSSVLDAQYFPPIELLPDKDYVLGLVELLTCNSIPNIDIGCNKLYVGEHVIVLPTGSYEIEEIEKYIKEQVEPYGISFSLEPNNSTLRCSVKCSEQIDFEPQDSIGSLLGFTKHKLEPGKRYHSDLPVKILKINALRVECNLTSGAFINGEKAHTIHEFFPAVPPGYKIIEIPSQIIYLPVIKNSIDNLQIRIVDQEGNLVNFRGEVITVRLHIKKVE